MAENNNNYIFKNISVWSRGYLLKRTANHPLDAQSVFDNIKIFNEYLSNDNIYSGLIISLDNNDYNYSPKSNAQSLNDNVLSKDKDLRGAYYVTRKVQDGKLTAEYEYKKLAFNEDLNNLDKTVKSDIQNKLNPIISLLNKLNKDNKPWDEITEISNTNTFDTVYNAKEINPFKINFEQFKKYVKAGYNLLLLPLKN